MTTFNIGQVVKSENHSKDVIILGEWLHGYYIVPVDSTDYIADGETQNRGFLSFQDNREAIVPQDVQDHFEAIKDQEKEVFMGGF